MILHQYQPFPPHTSPCRSPHSPTCIFLSLLFPYLPLRIHIPIPPILHLPHLLPLLTPLFITIYLPLPNPLILSLPLTIFYIFYIFLPLSSSHSPPSPRTSSHSFHPPLPIPLPLVTPLILLLFLLTPLFKYPFSIIYRNCMHRQCTVQRDNKNVI